MATGVVSAGEERKRDIASTVLNVSLWTGKKPPLRTHVEILLGGKFNQRAFHDFILRLGLLPPDLLANAAMEEFITRPKSGDD